MERDKQQESENNKRTKFENTTHNCPLTFQYSSWLFCCYCIKLVVVDTSNCTNWFVSFRCRPHYFSAVFMYSDRKYEHEALILHTEGRRTVLKNLLKPFLLAFLLSLRIKRQTKATQGVFLTTSIALWNIWKQAKGFCWKNSWNKSIKSYLTVTFGGRNKICY